MRFANFNLGDDPSCSIVLVGLGHEWDIHNCADLVEVDHSVHDATASLEWLALAEYENPWGSPGNTAIGCRLLFFGVRLFEVRGSVARRDNEDSRRVARVAKVIPGEEEYPHRLKWGEDELFWLRIETEAGGRIDIDAEMASLVPIRLDV